PLRESVRYHGISSAGGGRAVRPRSAGGRLASSHVRTSLRNCASAGVSRRNMASFHLDVRGLHHRSPLRKLVGEQLAELGRSANLVVSPERKLASAPIFPSSICAQQRLRG